MSYIAARQMLTFQLGAGNVQKWFHALVPGSQIFVAEWPGELLARSLGIVEVFLRKTRDRTTPVVVSPFGASCSYNSAFGSPVLATPVRWASFPRYLATVRPRTRRVTPAAARS